jgi:ADP-dependent NAD(P)H-hydrate dehydratase / NAD(P)H-hydrate epimerase
MILRAADIRRMLPRRPANSHKGQNGHVLLVAGSRGMAGAAILSGLGALRVGAGLLTIGIVEGERRTVAMRLPEAMTLPLPETRSGALAKGAIAKLSRLIENRRVDVVGIGPGLSRRPDVASVVRALLRKLKVPIVLDADGLNVLRARDIWSSGRTVITPHAGELAHLVGVSRQEIERNRIDMARKTARDLGVVCVLKGHRTVISSSQQTRVNSTGNQAMATGGMGDVLTGVIAGLLAQGLSPFEAACAGVYLHGLAGDLACVSDRGLLATELASLLPQALRKTSLK